jgi:uncharacterized protein
MSTSAHDLITRYLASAKAGDWDAAFDHFAEDLLVRIPGRSPFAGEHRGKAVAIDYITSIRERYGDEHIELELVDVLVGEERVALLVRERFGEGDAMVEIRRANVYRVADGKIAEIAIFEGDQYAVDGLLAAG